MSFIRPFSESMIATGRVFGNSEKMMMVITVMGTLKIIPVTPQIVPQNAKAKMVTKALMFMVFPISFGSRMFPTNS